MNKFYVKNSYFNYDKKILCCTAILLACKVDDTQGDIADIARAHLSKENSLFQRSTALTTDDIKETISKITLLELKLLKERHK